jgi:Dolichyl-phosphate-mannose-protein mannosyltransferase
MTFLLLYIVNNKEELAELTLNFRCKGLNKINTTLQNCKEILRFLILLSDFKPMFLLMIDKITVFFEKASTLKTLLWAGILLRILVFFAMNPQNPDPHHEVLAFIVKNHRLPYSNELFLACHPPFYYLTALPFYVIGGLKFVQFYGLLTSCLNLWLIAKLLEMTIKDVAIRNLSFLLAAFLGMYLVYSLFISNDTLAVLMGTWFFYTLLRYLREQTLKNEVIFALSAGLALLTKSTFIPFIPFALAVVFLVRIRQSFIKMASAMMIAGAVIGLTGSYKYLENHYKLGQYFVHNLEIFPLPTNAIFYQGPQSFYNFNLLTLIKDPNLSSRNPSIHAAPLLIYGTFWYKHVYFENNLTFGNYSGFRYIGSLFFVVGILPSLLILLGIGLLIRQGFVLLINWQTTFGTPPFWNSLFEVLCIVLLLGSVATMFTGIFKYNDWAFMHTRLLVHVFFPIVLALAKGLSFIKKTKPSLNRYFMLNLLFFAGLTIVYFLVESGVLVWNWLQYGNKDEIQWYVNKSLGL